MEALSRGITTATAVECAAGPVGFLVDRLQINAPTLVRDDPSPRTVGEGNPRHRLLPHHDNLRFCHTGINTSALSFLTRDALDTQSAGDKIPVHQMIEKGGDEVSAPILVVQVIGMLPDIAGQQRGLRTHHR